MAGFPRLRFLRPPSEPDMHVAAHPALHEPRFLNRCSVLWKSSTRHSSACRYSASTSRSERPLRFAVPLRHVAGFPGRGLLRELRPTRMRPVGHGPVGCASASAVAAWTSRSRGIAWRVDGIGTVVNSNHGSVITLQKRVSAATHDEQPEAGHGRALVESDRLTWSCGDPPRPTLAVAEQLDQAVLR